MCGISGYFGRATVNDSNHLIGTMLDMIAHRGPDGRGLKSFDEAGLGHVRLAIIDIDGGQQPMATEDKRYWVSYNGELYNFREIKKRLLSKGIHFKTNSDTEVLLKAFVANGVEAVTEFRGMFSLAIWDNYKKEGFLIRDRYGIKPLFYKTYKSQVFFASEIKAINKALDSSPGIDLTSLHKLMNFRYIPGERTLFEDVKHLPPGYLLHWTSAGYSIKKWATGTLSFADSTTVDTCKDLLESAVHRQLVSDVPIGSYLSGGVDSATVLALSVKDRYILPVDFPTFTIRTGDSLLEGRHADETARLYGVPNYQEEFDSNLEGNLHRLIWHLEVPKVNAYQSAMVARLASKHVRVALSGLGADEIFLGYNLHKMIHNLGRINSSFSNFLVKAVGNAITNMMSPFGLSTEEYSRGGQVLESLPCFSKAYGIIRNVWDSSANREKIYGERMLGQDLPDMFDYIESKWPEGDDHTKNCANFELENKMVNDLLLQEDRLSMAFGLEVRVPFLDENLVGSLTALPSAARIPGGKLKKLMKDSVSEWLPETILQRPKSGFQIPVHQMFVSHLKPLADRFLSPARLEKDGLFNPQFVNNIIQAKPSPRLRWHYFMLYLMIGTNIWMDVFQNNTTIPQWSETN
jgi:asparagine synthase (glutamine-hydrolysing)